MEQAPQFSTPEQELAYLREQVAQREAQLVEQGTAPGSPERAQIISEQVVAHQAAPETVLAPEYQISEATKTSEADAILTELNLGGSEAAVKSLLQTMTEKGIKNALSVMEKLGDPHVTDDFHRYLVRYVAAGLTPLDIDEKAPRFQALKMTLYEIALPEPKSAEQGGRTKTLKELISGMEQFYAGLLSVEEAEEGEPHYFALELAIPADSPHLQFYAAVPNSKKNLFEKQLLSIFPDASLVPQPADYNVFVPSGTTLTSTAKFTEHPVLPLTDYTEFDQDPL